MALETERRRMAAAFSAGHPRQTAALYRLAPSEGWLEQVLSDKDERALLRSGKRYMSNITIVAQEAELKELPQDVLLTRLGKYSKGGVFTGGMRDRGAARSRRISSAISRKFMRVQIRRAFGRTDQRRPCISTKTEFCHRPLVSPLPTFSSRPGPAVMTLCRLWSGWRMELGRAAGFEAPATSLVVMPNRMPPALLVERFDIRESNRDTRRCPGRYVLRSGFDDSAKYDGTMERVARASARCLRHLKRISSSS